METVNRILREAVVSIKKETMGLPEDLARQQQAKFFEALIPECKKIYAEVNAGFDLRRMKFDLEKGTIAHVQYRKKASQKAAPKRRSSRRGKKSRNGN